MINNMRTLEVETSSLELEITILSMRRQPFVWTQRHELREKGPERNLYCPLPPYEDVLGEGLFTQQHHTLMSLSHLRALPVVLREC